MKLPCLTQSSSEAHVQSSSTKKIRQITDISVRESETESKRESRKLTDSFQERKKYTSNEFAIIIGLFRTALKDLEKNPLGN